MMGTQERELLEGFHTLGNDLHFQVVAERDDGARDHGMAVVQAAAQEGPVDLDEVDREFLQVAQARITGAEVVDRQAHAQRLQFGQRFHRLGWPVHQLAFRHFQFQHVRVDPVALQHLGQVACKLALA